VLRLPTAHGVGRVEVTATMEVIDPATSALRGLVGS